MNATRSNSARNTSLFKSTRGRIQQFPSTAGSVFSTMNPAASLSMTSTTVTAATTPVGVNWSSNRGMSSASMQASVKRSSASPALSAAQSQTMSGLAFPATRTTALPPSSITLHPANRGIASMLFHKNIFGDNLTRVNNRDPMIVAAHVEAAYQRGRKYQYGLGVNQNLEIAAESYLQASYEGHADSCCALGTMFLKGEVSGWVDYEKARQLYTVAASVGHAPSQFKLGEMYESGHGVSVDPLKAQHWYIEAAKRNYAPALCNLGTMYAEGDGVEHDPVRAVQLLRKAADQGLADAQCCLALMYMSGEGVEADEATAEEYYMRAAEQGHSLAQVNLGHLYYNQDNAEMARECWELAAKQGVALALCNLGAMYMTGQGVPQSYSKAYEYYSAAAHKGDFEAQYQLGVLYEHGYGVSQQPSTALSWFNKAAQQGHTEAKEGVLRLRNMHTPPSSTGLTTSSKPKTSDKTRIGSVTSITEASSIAHRK